MGWRIGRDAVHHGAAAVKTLAQHYGASGSFDEAVATRNAVIAVIGLGYVGLPLALACEGAGFGVAAVDIDTKKVAALRAGKSYMHDMPSERIAAALSGSRLEVSVAYDGIARADVVFICVPTPFTRNKEPDTSCIQTAANGILPYLKPGAVVILRSTSYPGTTEELVRPLLESRGARVGSDLYLAFAPERVDPGRQGYTIRTTPVLVGGCDPESTRRACLVLGQLVERVVPMSSPAAAEMAKLLENVFRNVNIALVNQLAMLCERMGLDVWEIVDAAATKPYGFLAFRPGPGVGGHCIPVDPYYLAWKAREYDFHMDFIELAARVNDEMPYYVATRILLALDGRQAPGEEARVLLLGVTFKADVDDYRDSPALKIIERLLRRGVHVDYSDPYVPQLAVNGRILTSQPLSPELLSRYDCVVITADHQGIDYGWVVRHARKVFDTRNGTRDVTHDRDKIVRL